MHAFGCRMCAAHEHRATHTTNGLVVYASSLKGGSSPKPYWHKCMAPPRCVFDPVWATKYEADLLKQLA